MLIALRLLLFWAAGVAALTYAGFWAARLLLPPTHRRYTLLVSPMLGFCVLAVVASWLNSSILGMGLATPLILLVLLPLNGLALKGLRRREFRSQDVWAPLAMAALSYIIGSLPQVLSGEEVFVAAEKDLNIFLPLAEYLKLGPAAPYIIGPDNPMLALLNRPDVRGGSGWGFTWVEATIEVLLGWTSIEGFRPMLELCFSLGAAALYFAARTLFRMPRAAATVCAALWPLSSTNLFVASIALAGHAASMFLVPLALALTVTAAERRTLRAAAAAALAISGMLLCFYTGALLVWAALLAGMLLPLAIATRRRWRSLLATGALTAILVVVLAGVGHARFLEVVPVYNQVGFSEGLQQTRFIPMTEAFSVTLDPMVSGAGASRPRIDGPLKVVLGLASLGVFVVELAATALACITTGWSFVRFGGALAAYGVLLVMLNLALNYPYGYFKVATMGNFLVTLGLAHVAVAAWQRPAHLGHALRLAQRALGRHLQRTVAVLPVTDGQRWAWRRTVLLFAVPSLCLLVVNLWLTLGFFIGAKRDEITDLWQLRTIAAEVLPGAKIAVAITPHLLGWQNQMVGYFLLRNVVVPDGSPEAAGAEYLLVLTGATAPASIEGLTPRWERPIGTLYQLPEMPTQP